VLEDSILVLDMHPFNEQNALTCDYNGQIVLWDILEGVVLNIFSEKGYAIGYPNLDMPILDGCFSVDGNSFIISTYFGCFSVYGYGSDELYNTTPVEQFFANDYDQFIYENGLAVMSLDIQNVEVHLMERGRVCNYQRTPYIHVYNNVMSELRDSGYFSIE